MTDTGTTPPDLSEDRVAAELEDILDRVPGLTGEVEREWWQFVSWGIAHGLAVLPAPAATLLDYLGAYPGSLATQRGRASAITAAHRRARRRPGDPLPIVRGPVPRVGLPSPAEAESVRRLLRPALPARGGQPARVGRAERLAVARIDIEPCIAALPTTGWPDALTGRRDALVLHLVVAGLSWDTIAGLRQRDIHLDDTTLVVGSQPLVELPATGAPATCPVQVMRRWATVLADAPRATGHITLHHTLTTPDTDEPVVGLLPEWADLPLLTRFDERGFADGVLDELDPLTPAEVLDIYTRRRGLTLPVEVGDLDNSYYERGVAARHRAHAAGRDLDDLLTALEARIDAVNHDIGWNDTE
ncbi:hypothetical protein [Nocardia thailandica]